MPLVDGEYQKLTKEEIKQRLENSLEDQLDVTANPGDLVTKQLEAEAATLAQNQEQAIERVHQAAYLADATGKELDKVVDVIGLERVDASPATGVVRLWRETPPTTTYTIPRGATVQTGGSDPVQFELTQQNRLAYISGFESDNLDDWEGDTADFSVSNTTEMSGNYALEVPATNGVSITKSESDFTVGTTFNVDVKPTGGSITAVRFGLQDQSNYLECVLDEAAQDITLRLVEDGNAAALSDNSSANIPADLTSHLEINWGLYEDTTAKLYETKNRDVELCSVSLTQNKEWTEGKVSVASLDSTATCLVDELSTRSVLVNIRGREPGTETNIGPNTITVIPAGITGVEDVTNPVQTGNPNKRNTNFASFALGESAESDDELRERAFNSTSIGGSATVNAISTEIRRIEGVQALTLNRNREESTVDGLPPHSFEAIVYGGTDKAVAEAIFQTASIDSHDVGGINGNEASYKITSEVTNQEEEINFSRPNKIDLNITLDLVVDENFSGETELRDLIVSYIGGTAVDGSFVAGLDVGEDVYEAILKREIVGPDEYGVWDVETLTIDADGDGNDDTTTTTSGADVFAVADNEVAITDARDGSITINTTQK